VDTTIKPNLAEIWTENRDLFHSCFNGFGCDEGWAQLIKEMLGQWRTKELPRIITVKEKLGLLRVTCEDRTDKRAKAVARELEKRSAQICELCGAAGELRVLQGHVATRCDDCLSE